MPSVEVKGMSCNHCVMSVKKALSGLPGVTDVDVSLEKGLATFEAAALDAEAVRQAIAKIGFEPGVVK
ncbi:heavy-metal-associated domain-containing protein [Desulfolutivibrio sulfoxidireducens]|uniref:heavy-metal-associated domain-containing protein n=1 Tax=Desulfolutivibrio sulfoxidireducens TaxID=2773299 RepID=UPI00159E2FF8|nr:heavy metal-associated domain-containing protein [Desulfolutivibrio sulfoxidireducens]QLA15605.1 mercury transporter [Desulfolutivibrio sulfoxidireducens]QLA19209.1 mercury transporter [Desulfolutivibrio sulfoxidireducens]